MADSLFYYFLYIHPLSYINLTSFSLEKKFCKIGKYDKPIYLSFLIIMIVFIILLLFDLIVKRKIMHKLFLSYGKYDFVQQIPQITYSTIITQLIELFLCFLSLTDKHIYRIRTSLIKGKSIDIPKIIRCMQIKLIIFFSFIGILLVVYWYIISFFWEVYRNNQIQFLKDSAISFSISLFYPFALYLLSTELRKFAVNDSKYKRFKCIYAINNINQ